MVEEEFLNIIDEYKNFLYEIYFSPPLGHRYHTRPQTQEMLQHPAKIEMLWNVLSAAKENNIKLNLVLNQPGLSLSEVLRAMFYVTERTNIDSVTAMKSYGKILRKEYPCLPLCVSYNDGIDSSAKVNRLDPEIFQIVTGGRSTIRNFKLFRYVKEKGFKTKLMLNMGCCFTCEPCLCTNCYRPNPRLKIAKMLKSLNVNQRYALQTIMPWEIHEHGYLVNKDIDIFKISNRPSNYVYLRNVIRSYIENLNHEMDTIYSETGTTDSYYHLWCRGNIMKLYIHEYDYDKIVEFKKEIWANEHFRNLMV